MMHKNIESSTWFLLLIALCACSGGEKTELNKGNGNDASQPAISDRSGTLPLNKIVLPEGFSISIYAEVPDARSMALSPSGTLFVGNRTEDKVYAVRDTNNDYVADKRWIIASGLTMPNGVAFKDGNLYVAEVSRILRFDNIESSLDSPPSPVVIKDDYPTDTHHGWKYIAFGPDGKLYVPVGAPCNICEPEKPIYAGITRINPDGSGFEQFASGVRNSVGITWNPETNEMWFTDNGRDMLGDDNPPDELNRATAMGQNFGYPYCHAGTIKDPDFGDKHSCNEFRPPARTLGPHVASLGLKFYTGNMFPEPYRGNIFIAEHGSWNRSKKIGYRISMVKIENNVNAVSYDTFANGWMDEGTQAVWGRPVDVLLLEDGSMLVSDDQAGVIYRISYKG